MTIQELKDKKKVLERQLIDADDYELQFELVTQICMIDKYLSKRG